MPTFPKPEDAQDDLTKLLLRAVPENEHGNKTLAHLAKLIGVSKWGLRKWIIAQKIPPERAMKITEISEGRVALNEFDSFVYKAD